LSRDSTISCASCHRQANGFADTEHELSLGIDNKIGRRNSLSLINLAWSKSFMWDGGVNHLEVQALNPITSPLEMDETLINVVNKLKESRKYKHLFKSAFGDSIITGQRILKAIAQFELMLKSSNSKYDQVKRKETVFTKKEQNGYRLFQINCASCHTEPLFASDRFEFNGLPIDGVLNDLGRLGITNNSVDFALFKVPTLRNIQVSSPYMHDGRFKSLKDVVKHYNSIKPTTSYLATVLQKPMRLSDRECSDLVSFLFTLTDSSFLTNKHFSTPKAITFK
jgi:cytochrome c peroxidase